MTKLFIYEEVEYEVDAPNSSPYEAMRLFLSNPASYTRAVRERDVRVIEPKLSFDEEIVANEAIARAEEDA